MNGFNFNDLNLSGIEVSTGGSILKPGRHIVKVKDLKVQPTKANDGSQSLAMNLVEANGEGSLKHWINVFIRTSAKATEIGREELKALLTWGGHPNPDKPGVPSSWPELTVGVMVKEEPYTKDGVTKTGSKVHYFCDPAEIDPTNYTPRQVVKKVASAPLNDDIPF